MAVLQEKIEKEGGNDYKLHYSDFAFQNQMHSFNH